MLFGLDPLFAYAIVGLGAAAYSPAKYGILTEYLPHRQLVVANGWIEGLTVASIILGTMLGGLLIHVRVSGVLLHFDMPLIETSIDTAAEAAIAVIVVVYAHRGAVQPRGAADRRGAEEAAGRPDGDAEGLRRAASATCGATASARSRSRSPRCSGARARRCSSSSSSGRASRSASTCPRPRSCRA